MVVFAMLLQILWAVKVLSTVLTIIMPRILDIVLDQLPLRIELSFAVAAVVFVPAGCLPVLLERKRRIERSVAEIAIGGHSRRGQRGYLANTTDYILYG